MGIKGQKPGFCEKSGFSLWHYENSGAVVECGGEGVRCETGCLSTDLVRGGVVIKAIRNWLLVLSFLVFVLGALGLGYRLGDLRHHREWIVSDSRLRVVALGLENYHSENGCFPRAIAPYWVIW